MIYLVLLLVFGIWAARAWNDRPLREFARIYFLCCTLTAMAEPPLIRLLRAYALHAWLLPDPQADTALTGIMVGLCLDPLLGALYARHCQRRPVLLALVAALLLGALEWYMVLTGFVVYLRPWSPFFAAAFFFAFFLVIWRAVTHTQRVPIWADTYGIAAFWAYGTDLLLQGVLRLWEFRVVWFGDQRDDTRALSDLLLTFAICPLVTLVATAPLRHRWIWVAATGAALWALELAAWAAGLIAMESWVLVLEVFRRLALVSLTTLYAGWRRSSKGSA